MKGEEDMATPHNSANKKDIAKIVLMVGDPIRAKKIAEKYLQDLKLVNNVRGMNTFTGKINGKRITIMPHGMGCPSVGIYTYELFKFYGVERIVRFGTIGALKGDTKVGTVIVANKTYTKTNYDDFYIKNGASYVSANEELVEKARKVFSKSKLNVQEGTIYCSDTFYTDEDQVALGKKLNLLGVEMESAGLYINANKFGKQALTICSVSDNLESGEALNAEDRENSFYQAIEHVFKIALEK